MNLVAEWIIISTPWLNALIKYGLANVLSTTNGILCLWAISAHFSKSAIFANGFPKVSTNRALVLSVIACSISSKLSGSTKVDSTP